MNIDICRTPTQCMNIIVNVQRQISVFNEHATVTWNFNFI